MFLFALTATWMIFLFEMIFSALFKLCFIFAIHFVLFYPSWRKIAMNSLILIFVYKITTFLVETLRILLFNRHTFELSQIILVFLLTKYTNSIFQNLEDIRLTYIKFLQDKKIECVTFESFLKAHIQVITKAIQTIKNTKPLLQLIQCMCASVTVFCVALYVTVLLSYVLDLFLVFFMIGFIRRCLDKKYSIIVPVESIHPRFGESICSSFVQVQVVEKQQIKENKSSFDGISNIQQTKKSDPTLEELLSMPFEESSAPLLFPDPRTQMDCSLNFESLLRMKSSMKRTMRQLPDFQTSEFCDQGCWIKCRLTPVLVSSDCIEIYSSYTMRTQQLYLHEIAHVHLVKNNKGFGEIELLMKESGRGSKVFRSHSFEEAQSWTQWMLNALDHMDLLDPMCTKCHSKRGNCGSFVTYDDETFVMNSEPECEPEPIVKEVPSKTPSPAAALRMRLPKKKLSLTSSVFCRSSPFFQDEFLNTWDFEISTEENEWQKCRLEGYFDAEPTRFKIRIKSSWENPITVHMKRTESVSYSFTTCSEIKESFYVFSFSGFHSNHSFELRCKSKDEAKLWKNHFESMIERTRIEAIGVINGPVTTATSMITRANLNVDIATVHQHYTFSF